MSNARTCYSSQAVLELLDRINEEKTVSHDLRSSNTGESRYFVPIGSIEGWFRGGQTDYARAENVLTAIFDSANSTDHEIPVSASDVTDYCCRVLCILVLIGKAEFIARFVRYDTLRDDRLPFPRSGPPEHFPPDPTDSDFYDKFFQAQWMFCAPKLTSASDLEIGSDNVLPFCYSEHLQGPVFMIRVHPRHDGLGSRPGATRPNRGAVHSGTGSIIQHLHPLVPHTYAVKSFRSRRRDTYDSELAAFLRVTRSGTRSAPGLIGFYGGFRYRDTFNIMLEYADGKTLGDLFHHEPTCDDGQQILDFWNSFLETLKGLYEIHNQHMLLQRRGTPERLAVILQG